MHTVFFTHEYRHTMHTVILFMHLPSPHPNERAKPSFVVAKPSAFCLLLAI